LFVKIIGFVDWDGFDVRWVVLMRGEKDVLGGYMLDDEEFA
jgi:hypothetical protein